MARTRTGTSKSEQAEILELLRKSEREKEIQKENKKYDLAQFDKWIGAAVGASILAFAFSAASANPDAEGATDFTLTYICVGALVLLFFARIARDHRD